MVPLISAFAAFLIFLPVHSVHAAAPIKILLVPGHDDGIWGAQYGNMKEADMNLALATDIYNLLIIIMIIISILFQIIYI